MAKVASRVNTLNDIRLMQRTIDKLVTWENRWEMDFNVNKYGVMNIAKRNLEFQYQMNDGQAKSVYEERYFSVNVLGLAIMKGMSIGKNRANLMLGIINRGVS